MPWDAGGCRQEAKICFTQRLKTSFLEEGLGLERAALDNNECLWQLRTPLALAVVDMQLGQRGSTVGAEWKKRASACHTQWPPTDRFSLGPSEETSPHCQVTWKLLSGHERLCSVSWLSHLWSWAYFPFPPAVWLSLRFPNTPLFDWTIGHTSDTGEAV